jgi:hypothetical protein
MRGEALEMDTRHRQLRWRKGMRLVKGECVIASNSGEALQVTGNLDHDRFTSAHQPGTARYRSLGVRRPRTSTMSQGAACNHWTGVGLIVVAPGSMRMEKEKKDRRAVGRLNSPCFRHLQSPRVLPQPSRNRSQIRLAHPLRVARRLILL